ncbi:hypothetical protein [Jiella pelagia]|uniref:Uncharacterized protein n=1 Tax=Jiella pelagia TaxID=2986949 RepID=A0ABY7C0P0_9HYPH|nr:hypothetical protein [Jiella pelagia]WAP69312.1 hypothetical protein OH818_03155 [Jiella pelagia]
MAQNCICTGPVCSCGAHGVVKDGAGVRVTSAMMDNATGGISIADRAASSKYDNVRGLVASGMPAEIYYATLDAGAEAARHVRSDLTKDREAALATGDRGASQALYEKRISDAWKQPESRKASDEAIDGAFAHLRRDAAPTTGGNGQDAYEKRIADAWRS